MSGKHVDEEWIRQIEDELNRRRAQPRPSSERRVTLRKRMVTLLHDANVRVEIYLVLLVLLAVVLAIRRFT